jgi:hypothetical protein
METGVIESIWLANDLGSMKETINPDFIEEFDLQEQIEETENTWNEPS